MIGSPDTANASAAGSVSTSANSSPRFSDARAASASPERAWRDKAGSNAVPTAVPITPSGSWFTRSA